MTTHGTGRFSLQQTISRAKRKADGELQRLGGKLRIKPKKRPLTAKQQAQASAFNAKHGIDWKPRPASHKIFNLSTGSRKKVTLPTISCLKEPVRE